MVKCCESCLLIAVTVLLCGCETIGAFSTGRITSSDVAYITHASTFGKQTTAVNVDSIEPDEENEKSITSEHGSPGDSKAKGRKTKIDAWLEENLW